MTKTMTSGSPMKHILGFAFPMLLGMLFQQMYNLVDSIIVGKLLGSSALASVGSTGSINFLVIGFCMGVCTGFAIPVAQRFGAEDHVGMRRAVANAGWLCAAIAAIMTVATGLLCSRILTWMHTPADIFEGAHRYILIIFLGIPAIFLYNMVSGVLRALGDSRTPVYFLAIASLLNIALDVTFIVIFHSGVEGAALATVIAQAVSGALCLLFIAFRYPILHISRDELPFNRKIALELCNVGIPMGLQYSITAVGCTVLQLFVNQLGTAAVAASSAGTKLGEFFCAPIDALAATMATYCGQNVGARRLDRLGSGVRAGVLLSGGYSLLALGVLSMTAGRLSQLFLDASEVELVALSSRFVVTQASFYLALTLVNILRLSIQGMGFSNLAMMAGVMEMVARALVGSLLVPRFGYTAVCFATPAAWITADLFLVPACISCIARLKRREADREKGARSPVKPAHSVG